MPLDHAHRSGGFPENSQPTTNSPGPSPTLSQEPCDPMRGIDGDTRLGIESGGGSEEWEKSSVIAVMQMEEDVVELNCKKHEDVKMLSVVEEAGRTGGVGSGVVGETHELTWGFRRNESERFAEMGDQKMVDTDEGEMEGNSEVERENHMRDSEDFRNGRYEPMEGIATLLGVETYSPFVDDGKVLQDDMELDALDIPAEVWEKLEDDAMNGVQSTTRGILAPRQGVQRVTGGRYKQIYNLSERQAKVEEYNEEKKRNEEWWAKIIQQLAEQKQTRKEKMREDEIRQLKGVIKMAINRIKLLQKSCRVANHNPSPY